MAPFPSIFVGTSGWYYKDWNPDLTLDWYLAHTGLNTIELNASFYRYPFPNQIKTWARKSENLRWTVKVHQGLTHYSRLKPENIEKWHRFRKHFEPLDSFVDFYLFQLPPRQMASSEPDIEAFFKKTHLGSRFALEPRHPTWFKPEYVEWASDLGLTLVSVDAPDLPRDLFNTSGIVYLRLHGRMGWYKHNYSHDELDEIAERLLEMDAERIYVYANNDHHMLENAQYLFQQLAPERFRRLPSNQGQMELPYGH